MVSILIEYQGDKHCRLTHGPSGTRIETDAPQDNGGRGESFSPTDLVAAALASCALTTMALIAEREGISFGPARAEVQKEMTSSPRRIAALPLTFHMPAGLSAAERQRMEEIARSCPVDRSLHPEVRRPMQFIYPD